MKNPILVILVLAGIGIGAYYLFFNTNPDTYTINPVEETVTTEEDTQSTENNTTTDEVDVETTTTSTTTVTTPVNTPVVPVTPTTASVSIKNFAFSSSTLTVKAGTKVTWTNSDTAPHTVTSDSGSMLNSGNLSTGQSFSFTFTEAGTYTYHCALHPSMTGTVVVN